jgi:hypothetical protein
MLGLSRTAIDGGHVLGVGWLVAAVAGSGLAVAGGAIGLIGVFR